MSKETAMAHTRTRQFLKEAFEEGAFERAPVRERNLTAIYHGSRASYARIGIVYNLSESRICKLSKKGFGKVWANSSEGLKQEYPFETLRQRKSIMPSKPEGPKLRKQREDHELEAELRDPNTPLERKQQLLDSITKAQARKFNKGENPLILFLWPAIRSGGYKINPRVLLDIVTQLKSMNFLVGTVHEKVHKSGKDRVYYVILSEDKNKILQPFANNELADIIREGRKNALSRRKARAVSQLCGPERDIPSSVDLNGGGTFSRIGNLLNKESIPTSRHKPFRDLITKILRENPNCPVPVYQYSGTFYYPRGKEKELGDFILKILSGK